MYDATADFWLVCKLTAGGVLILFVVEAIGQMVDWRREARR